MTPSQEKKYLVAVLKSIDNGPSKFLLSFWFDLLAWFAVAFIFFALFQAGNRIHPSLLALVALIVGVFAGFVSFAQFSAKRWPYFQPHIDRNSVVKRLSELGKLKGSSSQ